VTFLYTLQSGACPKSYGMNVAVMAGLPIEVCTYRAIFCVLMRFFCQGYRSG
jgi:DNA mismatch repair ATPase MutS